MPNDKNELRERARKALLNSTINPPAVRAIRSLIKTLKTDDKPTKKKAKPKATSPSRGAGPRPTQLGDDRGHGPSGRRRSATAKGYPKTKTTKKKPTAKRSRAKTRVAKAVRRSRGPKR